jgi:hypothetical protein
MFYKFYNSLGADLVNVLLTTFAPVVDLGTGTQHQACRVKVRHSFKFFALIELGEILLMKKLQQHLKQPTLGFVPVG